MAAEEYIHIWTVVMMDKREDNLSQMTKEEHMDSYREKIVEMVGQIENERFLKAIYISISEYLKENEP